MPPNPMIGRTLGHYRILDRLGHGGMGVVYRAEDLKLHRTVALKLAREEVGHDPVARERLMREACAASGLSHPNVAAVYEVAEADEQLYIAMELVDGEPLSKRIRSGPVDLEEVAHIGVQVADALEAAHRKGVIHRDIKPSNILIDAEAHVKVVDFGLALLTRTDLGETLAETPPTEAIRLTRSGSTVGTIEYMSPEQAEGKTPDIRADLFSLGVVLYELSTGKLPFEGQTPLAVAAAIIHDDPIPPRTRRPDMTTGMQEIILRCLSKSPAQRPASAAQVRDALQLLERGHSTGTLLQALGRRSWLGHPAFAAVVAAFAVAVVSLGVWFVTRDAVADEIGGVEARRIFHQARVYESRGETLVNLRTAEQMYRRALELEPDNPFLQANLAWHLANFETLYRSGEERVRESRRLSDEAIDARPDLALAWVARGRCLLLEGDDEGAAYAARRAIEAAPDDHRGYMVLGEALVAQAKVEAGLAELQRATDVGQGHIWARSRLADILFDQGRVDESAAEYRKVLEYAPDSPVALNNLSGIYLMRGNFVDAIRLLDRLLELQPDDYAASNLGTAYFYLDRMDEAIAAYRRAVEMAPDSPIHKQNLAEAYEKQNDLESASASYAAAVADYDRILAGLPQDQRGSHLAERSFCAAKLGHHEEALQNIEEALKQDPDSLNRLRTAARVHALVGNKERAYAFIRRAVGAGFPAEEIRHDPVFESYVEDPRFLDLLTQTDGNS